MQLRTKLFVCLFMSKKTASSPYPTKSELRILQVLWQFGKSSVRFVNDKLNEANEPVQYTTTLKLMQIMTEKGLLIRDDSNMKHEYLPAIDETVTKGNLLSQLMDDLFDGSPSGLMMQLLSGKKTSKKELEEIKKLIQNHKK